MLLGVPPPEPNEHTPLVSYALPIAAPVDPESACATRVLCGPIPAAASPTSGNIPLAVPIIEGEVIFTPRMMLFRRRDRSITFNGGDRITHRTRIHIGVLVSVILVLLFFWSSFD